MSCNTLKKLKLIINIYNEYNATKNVNKFQAVNYVKKLIFDIQVKSYILCDLKFLNISILIFLTFAQ